MGYSTVFRPTLQIVSPVFGCPSKLLSRRLEGIGKSKRLQSLSLRAVVNGMSGVSDNGSPLPARVLLERLFNQTQKFNHLTADFPFAELVLGSEADTMLSDLLTVVEALKKKEEDLVTAERKVFLDQGELNRAKEELERQEKAIVDACAKYEKLEEDLSQAALGLASQAKDVEDLKILLRNKDQEIVAAKAVMSLQEDELLKLKNELARKNEEAANFNYELKRRNSLVDEANAVVSRQQLEVQELQAIVQEKETEIEAAKALKKVEEEKLMAVRSNLENQTREWLLVQEQVSKLTGEISKHVKEGDDTREYFRRVRTLLSDVRSSLISSQKSLAHSRIRMEEHEQSLSNQFGELEELKDGIQSFIKCLRDGQMEVEIEKVNLQAAVIRSQALERDLLIEKELMLQLNKKLLKEKLSFERAVHETSLLQAELVKKNTEFEKLQSLLHEKEAELVEAKLEIQKLKAEVVSLQISLGNRDEQLFNAMKKLEEVNEEVSELRMLLLSNEDALTKATIMLKEKDEHVSMMQSELNDSKVRVAEAETVIERIVELTDELVASAKNGNLFTGELDGEWSMLFKQASTTGYAFPDKQLETELDLTNENLRLKEIELLTARRDLTVKDEELKKVMERLDAKEKECKQLKEEMIIDADDLKNLYALAQESIGEKRMGDLAIEKLQVEVAQLEVQAATSALQKLVEMSGELLNKASMSIDSDINDSLVTENHANLQVAVLENSGHFQEVQATVCHLSNLTEQLIKQAGITYRE